MENLTGCATLADNFGVLEYTQAMKNLGAYPSVGMRCMFINPSEMYATQKQFLSGVADVVSPILFGSSDIVTVVLNSRYVCVCVSDLHPYHQK